MVLNVRPLVFCLRMSLGWNYLSLPPQNNKKTYTATKILNVHCKRNQVSVQQQAQRRYSLVSSMSHGWFLQDKDASRRASAFGADVDSTQLRAPSISDADICAWNFSLSQCFLWMRSQLFSTPLTYFHTGRATALHLLWICFWPRRTRPTWDEHPQQCYADPDPRYTPLAHHTSDSNSWLELMKRRLGFLPRDYSEDVAQKLFSVSEKDKESPEQMEAWVNMRPRCRNTYRERSQSCNPKCPWYFFMPRKCSII